MKLKPRIDRPVYKPVREPREGMSASHLKMVQHLPCVVCGREERAPPHHLLRVDPNSRGTGMRNADRWALPMCQAHHNAIHDDGDEEKVLANWGIDGRAVATALWTERGNRDGMERVIFRASQMRSTTP